MLMPPGMLLTTFNYGFLHSNIKLIGMSRTHPRASSEPRKTTTTFFKVLRLLTFALPKRQRMVLMPGFSRTAYAGLLKEVLLLQVALMWPLSVCSVASYLLYGIAYDPH